MITTGFDLGIFEQAVRSYAHSQLPVSELKGPGFPLLGDHFSPILATLAPFYRLWPSPLMLLLAQAALFAVGVVPLASWAQRAAGRATALTVAFGYGISWGMAQAVGFDFHEVCFAVPLLAFSLTALGEGRLRAAVMWALPLLLVKEDLGLTAAVIGALVARRGRVRLGLVASAAGIVGTLLEVLLVIPAFNPGLQYGYWNNLSSGGANGAGLSAVLHAANCGLTVVLLLAPTAFMALRSPLLWTALPTLGWRFLSHNPAYWGTKYHYSAVLMPIVFAALVEAVATRPGGQRAARAHLAIGAAISVLLLPLFPLSRLADAATWHTSARITAAHRILDRIPDGATVAASNGLVPQLTSRATVSEFGLTGSRPDPEWIIVDTATPQTWPTSHAQQACDIDIARSHGYRVVTDQHGYLLLHRP
ncbi:DUF2079 domain-containing protein [Streptomyces sp. GS7]|uniref:DUF2079 domain-containing protein n=1 Tax=Streptomyces sp. GS7 TaxID=2692234 RepID=UPI001318E577|nr:DUF2079 domain-containing protein [Streptomyces sp. GS7]QHC23376.1 DUF2079 domain-containing protein [Streptomyces sp. GS7]